MAVEKPTATVNRWLLSNKNVNQYTLGINIFLVLLQLYTWTQIITLIVVMAVMLENS